MKKIYLQILAIAFMGLYSAGASAQTLTYSQSFTGGSSSGAQCTAWTAYAASLLPSYSYTGFTMKGSLNTTGISCTNAAVATAIASALHNGTSYTGSSDGQTWEATPVGGDGLELTNTGSIGNCNSTGATGGTAYSVRPCIGNSNWGGVGNTCGGATQTMEVDFFYTATPSVTVNPTPVACGVVTTGASSAAVPFTINGAFLTPSPLTVTAPAGGIYLVSTSGVAGTFSSSVTVPFTPTTLAPTTLYVQFTPAASISYPGNIVISGGGLSPAVNVAVTGTGAAVCSGTPTAGSAFGVPTSGTPTTSFTLSTVGTSVAGGLTYQWQSSPDNTTFTNIYAATNPTFTFTGLIASTYFRAAVTCPSFGTVNSSSQLLTVTGVGPTSCVPTYANTCYSYPMNTSISSLTGTSGTLTDPSNFGGGVVASCPTNYIDNTALATTTLNAGTTYTANLNVSVPYYASFAVQAWIDFNNNGTFETTESVGGYAFGAVPSSTPGMPMTIPAGVATGTYRLRIIGHYNSSATNYPSILPCEAGVTFGNARDYKINISGVTPPSPVGSIIVSPTTLAFGSVTTSTNSTPVQYFVASGTNLTATALSIAPPPGFAVSLNGATWVNNPGTLSLGYTPGFPTGSLSPTNVYVQFNPTTSTSYSGNVAITGGGVASAVNVAVSGNGQAACTGTPTPGTASLSPTAGGPSTVLTLSLAGTSAVGGLTYQWQSAPSSGGTYTSIAGAITPTYSFIGAAGTYYQCVVTCPSGGSPGTSNAVTSTLITAGAVATACNSFSGNCLGFGDYYFITLTGALGTSINTPTSGCTSTTNPYDDETSAEAPVTLAPGGTYSGTVAGYEGGSGILQVWIDFNDNGVFTDPGEMVLTSGGVTASVGVYVPYTIVLPGTANPGTHRMRTYWEWSSGTPTSCASTSYGEIRDFKALVLPAPPPCTGTPNPGIVSPSIAASCLAFVPSLFNVGETIAATGINYQWQTSSTLGGTYVSAPGVSNVQNYVAPTVTAPIYYRATLTCTNSGISAQSLPVLLSFLPPPPSITGANNVCTGLKDTLTDATSGGAWTSGSTAASVGSSSGIVTGVTAGAVANITYTTPNGCFTSTPITVNLQPAAISGTSPICGSLSATFTDGTSGGAWSSSNPSVASVGSTGVVTAGSGITSAATITYTSASGCPVVFPVTVNALSAITGASSVCIGFGTSLSDATPGGAWSTPTPGIATVNSSGLVTSTGLGAATISYTMPTTSCTATKVVNVTNPPAVYTMSGGGVYCSGGSGGSGVIGAHVILNGSDAGVSYQLYNGSTPVGTPVIGSGFFIDFGLQPVGCYGVIANPGTACSTTMAGTTCVSVNPLPTAYTVSGGGNYCAGGTGQHVFLNGSTIGITYQLFCATIGSGTIPIGTVVPGTSAAIDFGLQTTVGVYTIVGTNTTTGCIGNMAGSVTVSTNPLPAVQTVTASGSGFCLGGTGVTIGLTGSVTGTTYQLTFSGAPFGAPVAGTGVGISFGPQTTGGTYVVTATTTATGCTTTMSGTPTVTVNPLPTAFNVTGGGNYCVGSATGVPVGLSGSTIGVNYQLYYTATVGGTVNPVSGTLVAGTGGSISFGSSFLPLGSYSVQAVNPATTCTNNMTGSVAIGTNPLPAQLSVGGGGAYCAGTTPHDVTLSGSVAGTTYNLLNGTTLTGAASGTGASIDFGPEATPGTYTVTAAITATGCTNTMLGNTLVSINPLPNVFNVQAGAAGTSYCNSPGALGDTINLSNSNAGISYQLFNGGTPSGTAVPGTGSPISFGPHTSGAYTVVATNTSTACINNMTGSVAITANALPTVYALTGGGNFCAGGTGVPIGLSASNTGISYSLLRGATTVSTLAGAGAPINFGLQSVLGTYTITANNPTTTCSVTMSGSTVVGTNPLPVATYNVTVSGGTGGGNYCAGSAGPVVGLSSSDAGINYQLLLGGVPAPGTAPVAGIASSPIAFPPQTANGTYTIQAMNGTTGCTSTEAGNAVITAKALPSVFTVSGGGTGYCSGGAGIAVTLSATQSGVSYQLMNGAATVGAPIIGAGSAITFPPATTSGTYTIVATNSSSCSSNMSGSAIINILGLPTTYAITGGGAYCQGGSGVPIGMLSSSIGTNYQLMLAGVPVGAPVAGTGVAFSFGSSFTAAGPYTVVATVASTGCSATMTGTATVSINLLPAAHNITGGGNFCPGGTGSVINLDGSNTGTSYQLYAGSALSGAAVAGTNAPITFGSRTTTGVYTVIATNATCTGAMPGSVTIGLSALPVVFNVTGGGNICPSASVAVGLSGSSLGVGYQLYNSLTGPLGPVVPGTGFSLNFGSQTAAGVYTVVAMDNTTSCTNNMSGSATVAINPLPASHTVTGGGNYCQAGSGADVSLDGSDVGTRYQLYIGGVTPVGSYMAGTGMPLDFGSKTAAGNYTVVATSTATTCSSNMTGSAVVAIIPLPGVETVTGGGNYCAGGTGIDNVGLGNSETGVNYQLYNGTTPMGIAVAGTGGALNFGTLTAAGVYTVVGNNPATTCSNTMSGSATVVVNVLPTAYTVVGGGNYCQGGTGVHVMLSGSNVGIAYQLIVDGSAAGVPMAGTGSSLDFGLQTAGGSYTVMANNNTTTCANTMSGSVAVTVNPLPNVYTVIGAGTNYCAGGAGIDMTLSGSDAGINYQLYKGPATAGGAVAGTGFSIDLGSQTAPGTYTVIAVNPSTTCSNTMSGAPAVVVNPLPAAFTVAGGGNYCNGGTGVNVGLSSSNVGVRYQLWNSTTSTAAGAAMPGTGGALNFGLQTSAGTYTVVATNMATTCTNTMTGSAIVVVDALPTVTTVTGGGNYCAGSAGAHVNLSGSTAGVNYQLYDGVTPVGAPMGGTGLGIDFGAQAGAGAYTVMAVNTVTSCTDAMAGSVTVGISVLPTAYPVIGGGNYCPGSEGVNVSLSSSNTGISYQLYNGTAPVGAAWPGTGTAISFGTITAAGTYMVVGTNGSTGCSGNMSGTATVGINAQPTVYSVIGGGNYCAGSMGVHVGLNSSNSGINYQLVIDGTASGAPQSGTGGPLDFGMQTTAGSYSVVATNGTTGCTSTMSGTPAVAITPLVSPSVTLSTGTGNDTVCSGHLVSLSALVSNGGTTPVYVWSVNGTPQSATGSAFSYLPADGDVVTATVTSNAACATPPTVGTSIALSVLENGLPSVALSSAQGTSVCSGTSVTYTAATTFGGTAPTLTWLVNNINVSNAASYSYVPMNNDDIYVEMSSNYRCRTASPVSSNHLMMSVADSVLPTVTIAANPSGANIGSGQQLTLTADVSNGGPTPAYQWFVNGVPITGANLQSYTSNTYSNGDSVTCQVVSSGACTGLVGFNSVIVHISTGVKSVSGITGDIQVVPNPSKGFFIVKGTMSTTMDEEVTLEITDMLGQVVYTGKAMTHNGSINERIQLSNSIANGMYILSLHSDTDNKVFHVVIEQ